MKHIHVRPYVAMRPGPVDEPSQESKHGCEAEQPEVEETPVLLALREPGRVWSDDRERGDGRSRRAVLRRRRLRIHGRGSVGCNQGPFYPQRGDSVHRALTPLRLGIRVAQVRPTPNAPATLAKLARPYRVRRDRAP